LEPNDRRLRTDPAEPIEKAERNDPTDPIEKAEPTLPIERMDPFEAIERIEFSEANDQREDLGSFIAATITLGSQIRHHSTDTEGPDGLRAAVRGAVRTAALPTGRGRCRG
jgi:hypothetical protein